MIVCDVIGLSRDAEVDRQLFTLASLCLSLQQVLEDSGNDLERDTAIASGVCV